MARVKYEKSTLREVIFQLRFPKILKLTEGAPVAFQESILADYPLYNIQKNETVVEVNGQPQQQLNESNHCFISASGKTKVNLTSNYIAVSTLEYQRWEEFRSKIEHVLTKFYSCYNVSGIQRIGLRYKNLISRQKLELSEPWSALLKPNVLGPLALRDDIEKYKTEFELKNRDNCFTRHHYELVREFPSPELLLMLDCDYYYTGFYDLAKVGELSNKLHDLSQQFIEDSHLPKLLEAMQPIELEPWTAI